MSSFNKVIPATQQKDDELDGVRMTVYSQRHVAAAPDPQDPDIVTFVQMVTFTMNNGADEIDVPLAAVMNPGLVTNVTNAMGTGFANALAASPKWSAV